MMESDEYEEDEEDKDNVEWQWEKNWKNVVALLHNLTNKKRNIFSSYLRQTIFSCWQLLPIAFSSCWWHNPIVYFACRIITQYNHNNSKTWLKIFPLKIKRIKIFLFFQKHAISSLNEEQSNAYSNSNSSLCWNSLPVPCISHSTFSL